MKHTSLLRVAAVVIALAATAPSRAQQLTGSLEGVVVDDEGLNVPGATATLSGTNMMGRRVVITDAGGRFRFVLVPPGKYTVEVSLDGFQTVVTEDVPVSLGQTAELHVTLALATFAETVEVLADQVLIDTTASEVGGNLTGEFVGTLANDRQYQMVMALLPGAIEANNPYMHGGSGADNMYLVDGADNTDPFTRTWSTAMNFDNLEEVQVITAGAPAEYGRGTGAVVNLVTKSGSNELHGTARYTYSDTDLNSELRGDRFYFREPTKYVDEKRPALNLGGPILKDRLWFFTSWEKREKTIPTAFIGSESDSLESPIEYTHDDGAYKGRYLTGKLSWQVVPEHRLFAHYSEDPIDIPNLYAYLGYQNRAPSADALRFQGGWNVMLDWTGILSSSSYANLKYNIKRNELNNDPNTWDGPTFYNGLVYWGATVSPYFSDRDHDIIAASYSHFVDTPAGGHDVKAGLERADIDLFYNSYSYAGDELIRYRTGTQTPQYRVIYTQRRGGVTTANEQWSAYLQDTWRVTPRLTFNIGLRLETLEDRTAQGLAVLDWGWGDRIQPRIGIAYDLGTGSLHGHLGRYHDTTTNYPSRTMTSTPDEVYDYFLWSAAAADWIYSRTYTIGAAYATFDPDLGSPYMDEITAGYQGKLSSTLAWGVDALYRVWRQGIEDDDGRDVAGNPADDGNYHFVNIDGKTREYTGVELTLRKMPGLDGFQFIASYTYSEAESYWDDTDQSGGYADSPFQYHNYWGPVSYDHRHVVKFNGSYRLPLDFMVGGNFTFWSGAPYTVTSTVETAPDGPYGGATYSYFAGRHGAERLPDAWRFDLRIGKDFRIGRITAGVYVDVFNLFDNQEVIDIDSDLGTIALVGDEPGATYTVIDANPRYGSAVEWQPPRSYFIGARIEF